MVDLYVHVTENQPPITPQKHTPSIWSKDKEEMIRQMRVCFSAGINSKHYNIVKGRSEGTAKTEA